MLRCVSLLLTLADAAASTTPAPASGGSGGGFPWSSIVGGVVGAALAVFVRSLDVPAEVARIDAAIETQDQAFSDWLADLGQSVWSAVEPLRADGDAANQRRMELSSQALNPGSPAAAFRSRDVQEEIDRTRSIDAQITALRSDALARYREREREFSLEVAKIAADEQWQHRLFRRLSGRTRPELTTIDRAEPLLDEWRRTSNHGGSAMAVDDPTVRTLENVIQRVVLNPPSPLPTAWRSSLAV